MSSSNSGAVTTYDATNKSKKRKNENGELHQTRSFFPGCDSSSYILLSSNLSPFSFFLASIWLILWRSLESFCSLFCFRVLRPSCIFTPNWNAAFGIASFCSLYFAHSSSVSKSHRWRRPLAYKKIQKRKKFDINHPNIKHKSLYETSRTTSLQRL